jgi:hypothetical protein
MITLPIQTRLIVFSLFIISLGSVAIIKSSFLSSSTSLTFLGNRLKRFHAVHMTTMCSLLAIHSSLEAVSLFFLRYHHVTPDAIPPEHAIRNAS